MSECKRPSFNVGIMDWVRYANSIEAEIALKADYIKRLEAENEELETQLSLSISMYEGDRSPMHNLQVEHAALKREYGLLEVTFVEVLKDKGQLLDENAVLIKRLWDYEHQASDERIRDEK